MKGISPIIATILLIVMTVAIAGLLYAWLSGLFGSLTASASTATNKLTQTPSFYISQIYDSGGNIYAIIYNNGNIPVVISSVSGVAQEYYTANDSYDGNTYTCTASNTTTSTAIPPGSQSTVLLSCTSTSGGTDSTIISNVNSGLYYYVFSLSYDGITETAQLT
ncbi:hypothetical protein YN1_1520 [Nanoarchaeota archaeon]